MMNKLMLHWGFVALLSSAGFTECAFVYTGYTITERRAYQTSETSINITFNVNNFPDPLTISNTWYYTEISVKKLYQSRFNYSLFYILPTSNSFEVNHLVPGGNYSVEIVITNRFHNPLTSSSDRNDAYIALLPKALIDFSISFAYTGMRGDGRPQGYNLSFAIQRGSPYNSTRIECKSTDGVGTTFSRNYTFQYQVDDENIALEKPTGISSGWRSDKAVDGIIGHRLLTAQTTTNDRTKWWRVDLRQKFQIQRIDIYVNHIYNGRYINKTTILSSDIQTNDNPCHHSLDYKKRYYRETSYDVVSRIIFQPTFSARIIAICANIPNGKALELNEVQIFKAEEPIRRTDFIDVTELSDGTAYNCVAFSIVNFPHHAVRSNPTELSNPLLTSPLPPKDFSFTLNESAYPQFMFIPDERNNKLYQHLRTHFRVSNITYTVIAMRKVIFKEKLIPGKQYTIESWTSAQFSVGRVNSRENLTSTFRTRPASPKGFNHTKVSEGQHLFSWLPTDVGLSDGFLLEICTPSKCLGVVEVENTVSNSNTIEHTWDGTLPPVFQVLLKTTYMGDESLPNIISIGKDAVKGQVVPDRKSTNFIFVDLDLPIQIALATIYALLVLCVGIVIGVSLRKRKSPMLYAPKLPPPADKTHTKFPTGINRTGKSDSEYSQIIDTSTTVGQSTVKSQSTLPPRRSTVTGKRNKRRLKKRVSKR